MGKQAAPAWLRAHLHAYVGLPVREPDGPAFEEFAVLCLLEERGHVPQGIGNVRVLVHAGHEPGKQLINAM